MVDLPNRPSIIKSTAHFSRRDQDRSIVQVYLEECYKGCFSRSMTHKWFMVYWKGIHAKGLFVTFVVVWWLPSSILQNRDQGEFYVAGLGGLSEEKLILLLGLDECLLEQIGVWQ